MIEMFPSKEELQLLRSDRACRKEYFYRLSAWFIRAIGM